MMIRCPSCNRFGVEHRLSGIGYECLWKNCRWQSLEPPQEKNVDKSDQRDFDSHYEYWDKVIWDGIKDIPTQIPTECREGGEMKETKLVSDCCGAHPEPVGLRDCVGTHDNKSYKIHVGGRYGCTKCMHVCKIVDDPASKEDKNG